MPVVTYIQPDGVPKQVQVEVGQSVMEGAILNGVKGIVAECGGACSCATCHVSVDPEWWGEVGSAEDDEVDMLEFAPDSGPTSRLGCQVRITNEMDGLVVRIPEVQG